MGKFYRRGTSEIHFVPVIAGFDPDPDVASVLTEVEVSAGIPLHDSVADISGWEFNNSPIETPNLGTTFNSQIDGPDAASDCSLIFDDDDADDSIRTALAKGTNGFIVLMPYGWSTAGDRCEVWPVRSTGYNDNWDMGAVNARSTCGFAVTDRPDQNVDLPAPPVGP